MSTKEKIDVASFVGNHDKILEMYKEDMKVNNGIRALNEYEREIYGGAVLNAVGRLPYFADAYAVLKPFVDASAETAYTDQYARVGFGYWFFYVIDLPTRVTWLTHEAMHVLNNHWVRGETLGISNSRINKMGDLEINTTLQTVPSMSLDGLLLPEIYELPKLKTLEIYTGLVDEEMNKKIDEDAPDANDDNEESGDSEESDGGSGESEGSGEGQGSSEGEGSGSGSGEGEGSGSGSGSDSGEGEGSGSGSGSGDEDTATTQEERLKRDLKDNRKSAPPGIRSCDELTDERSQGADAENVEKASPTSQNIARNNTKARMVDKMNNRGRGDGSADHFLQTMIQLMSPPRVDWRELLRRAVATAYSNSMIGRSFTSYKKINRRYSQGKVMFPGTVDMTPTTMFGIDTSGSMGQDDYGSLLVEIEGILKQASRSRDGIKVFSVDTKVQNVKPVTSVSKIDLQGGGGTDMSVAFAYVNSLKLKERPNIFILGTDGGTDWDSIIRELRSATYIPIILVTTKYGNRSVPDQLRRMATVIDISGDSEY